MTTKERTTMNTGAAGGLSENSSTFITDIEPRQLEPVEFIVSGSATGVNNTLQQYPGSSTSNFASTQRTVTSSENIDYNSQTMNMDSSENYAPYFINSLSDQTVREGEPVLFEIVISALPLAEVIWDRDGETITVDSSFRLDYYGDGKVTLYIPETFLDDQGYYTCTARNTLGTCRTTARLMINSTDEGVFATRRQGSTSVTSSTIQHQQQSSGPYQPAAAAYRVYAHSQPSTPTGTFKENPATVVTQVTEETQVIHIPSQQPQQQQYNEITYTIQDKQPRFDPVSFQVSTMKENIQPMASALPPPGNDENNPNPFKIFGAKLRSRPAQGIVPSYDDQTFTSYAQQSSSTTNSQYQQPSSSSLPPTQPHFTKIRQ